MLFVLFHDDEVRPKLGGHSRQFLDIGVRAVAGVAEQQSEPAGAAAQVIGDVQKTAQAIGIVRVGLYRLGSRIGQQLNPVQAALGRSTRRIGDSHLGEPRVHDVFAVPGAVEPALHHFVGRFGAVGNILTH